MENRWMLAVLAALTGVGCDPGAGADAKETGTGGSTSSPGPILPTIEDPGPLDTSATCAPGPMPTSGTLQGRWGSLTATVAGQEYFLQVNEWGASEPQTIEYGGDTIFRITQQEAEASTNGAPTGFPCMFIGSNNGHATANSNLPKAVSELVSVPTTWTWNDVGVASDTVNNQFNATYDVWFSTTAAGDPGSPSGGYLMVWLYDPPLGNPMSSGQAPYPFTNVTVPGVSGTWDVFLGLNNSKPVISYIRRQATYGMTFDLNAFIQDAVNNRPGSIEASWYLTNVFIGFEIWRGGVGVETTGFCAFVN